MRRTWKSITGVLLAFIMVISGLYITDIEAEAAGYASFDTRAVYSLRNVGTGKYLNIPGNSSGRVPQITIWPKDGTTGQMFTFSKVSNWYTLTPKCAPSMRVNVEGNTSKHTSFVGTWKKHKPLYAGMVF